MAKFEHLKRRLEAERARLDRLITSRRASVGSHGGSSVNDAFSDSGDNEYADAATDAFEQALDVSMLGKFKDRRERVRHALERMEAGRYGVCVRCQLAIAASRLDAVPETPYCRDCEADVEAQD